MKQSEKIGISIIDIKATSEENINKSHFIELVYYLAVIYHFIKENN